MVSDAGIHVNVCSKYTIQYTDQARKSQSIKPPLISLLWNDGHAIRENKRAKSVQKGQDIT